MSKVHNFDEKPDNICLFYIKVKSCYDLNQDFDISFECQQETVLKLLLNFTNENFCYVSAYPEKYLSWKNNKFLLNWNENFLIIEIQNFRGSFECRINKIPIFNIFIRSYQNIKGVKINGNVKIKEAFLVNKDITHPYNAIKI
ncbi:Hypothetical protein SRAE_X000243700 [Strongyloides ratti]|uniref:Galectin n=1 Tax=Strongyloides ratti TaxID=34506 RepID=A0A090KZU0_STRRB|nr:Hypothetical protein SRAE_X000243700 [Strongyloides ratti]CEF60704.1 Hypothetical protein SRAE_X000243700 [Strongyloides ratti]